MPQYGIIIVLHFMAGISVVKVVYSIENKYEDYT
jgi:hypothetical protein